MLYTGVSVQLLFEVSLACMTILYRHFNCLWGHGRGGHWNSTDTNVWHLFEEPLLTKIATACSGIAPDDGYGYGAGTALVLEWSAYTMNITFTGQLLKRVKEEERYCTCGLIWTSSSAGFIQIASCSQSFQDIQHHLVHMLWSGDNYQHLKSQFLMLYKFDHLVWLVQA